MIINTEIIDTYLAEKSLDKVKNHWIFDSIVYGKHLIEEPKDVDEHKLNEVYNIIIEKLKNFVPLNENLWHEFFGNMKIPDKLYVYLVVGSPKPYDTMVRDDKDGNSCIIIDLVRISSYSDDISKISDIVSNFVTHEISHLLINNVYPYEDSLEYIVFDEGIAHLLSFKKDVLSIDWYSDEMNVRRKSAYKNLINALDKISDDNKDKILEDSNSGLYWNKFGAISGLFALIDYYNYNGKNIRAFEYIFKEGPDALIKFIKSLSV